MTDKGITMNHELPAPPNYVLMAANHELLAPNRS